MAHRKAFKFGRLTHVTDVAKVGSQDSLVTIICQNMREKLARGAHLNPVAQSSMRAFSGEWTIGNTLREFYIITLWLVMPICGITRRRQTTALCGSTKRLFSKD